MALTSVGLTDIGLGAGLTANFQVQDQNLHLAQPGKYYRQR